MKKSLFILAMLLCLALFALPAMATEAVCTNHYAKCTAPNVCATCGQSYIGEVSHSADWTYVYNDTHHWFECKDCDTGIMEYGTHYASCTNQGVCTMCEQPCDNYDHFFIDSDNPNYDDTYHWFTCTACGTEELSKREHIVACYSNGTCVECGIAVSLPITVHESVIAYSAADHFYWCNNCEVSWDNEAHTVMCNAPTVCVECNYNSCSVTVTHAGSTDGAWYSDEENHWQLCECGEKINENGHDYSIFTYAGPGDHKITCSACNYGNTYESHGAICNSGSGVCYGCGVATNNLKHTWTTTGDGTNHWTVCTVCGEEGADPEAHFLYCNDNGSVCSYCGLSASSLTLTHLVMDQQRDETGHWYYCSACSQDNINRQPHIRLCSYIDSTSCSECAYDPVSVPISHAWNSITPAVLETKHNETEHWGVCEACEEEVEGTRETHTVICSNPGVCIRCGATGCTNELQHTLDTQFTSDATHHWLPCRGCSEYKSGYAEHFNDCVHLDTCALCGADYVGTKPITHETTGVTYSYDDTYCWQVCPDCGEIVNKNKHAGECYDTRCGYCLLYDGDFPRVHSFSEESEVFHDETSHWQECWNCPERFNEAEHTVTCDNPGVCTECGATDCTNEPTHTGEIEILYDETRHWEEYSCCGEIGWEGGEHYNVCISGLPVGRCVECAYDQVTTFYHIHDGGTPGEPPETTTKYSDTEHWEECNGCNTELADTRATHTVTCDNPGVCTECGATDCTNEPTHTGEIEILYDETRHWEEYSCCGEIGWEGGEHYNVCISGLPLGRCVECDYDQTTTFYHTYDGGSIGEAPQTTWNHNETECWKECIGCNAEMADTRFPHHTSCTNPGVCTACGTEVGDEIEMMHYRYADTPYEYDETHHWFICVMCNEPAMKGEHKFKESERDENKIVYTCGCGATKEENLHVECTFMESSRVEASCGVAGKIVYSCACGKTKTEEIPALTHSYSTIETPATCEADGKKVTTCANCGDESTEIIPATGHKYATVETPATCEADGKKVTTCANCGDESTEIIPATGHKYATVETPATCEADGKKVTTCANCSDESTEIIPATGHKYATVETPATCKKEGKKVTTCANCGEKTTEVLPIAEHAFEIITNTAAKCTTDGERVIQCTECGKEIVSVTPALGHAYTLVSDTAPTCEAEGEKISTCSTCGFELAEITPAVGHAYGSYLAKGDGTHVSECAVCGHERQRNCSYQNVTTNGITLTVCTVCGHTHFAHIAIVPLNPSAPAETETTVLDETQTGESTQDLDVAPTQNAETVTPDTLFIPVKVENVVVKSTKDDQAEVLPAGTQLVVYNQSAMLQEDSPILALYTIGLESDGYARKPEAALQIELPLTEEQHAEDFAQYKLVVIGTDGTMTEIEYVIEEGKIIFETDLVGIFAFLPIEE